MGKTVLISLGLMLFIAGLIIVAINSDELRLVTGLGNDSDTKLAKFISNTYAHNTVKDIRSLYIDQASLIIALSPTYYVQDSNIFEIANSEVKVMVYTDSLPGIKKLMPNKEWGVMSIGRVNAAICTTKTVYKRMPFTEFSLFTNSFPNSYYGDGELIDGPVYVNGFLGVGTFNKYSSTLKGFPLNSGPIFTDIIFVTKSVSYSPKEFANYFKGYKGGQPIINHPIIAMPTRSNKLDLNYDLSKTYQLTSGGNTYGYIFLRGEYLRLSIDNIENNGDDKVIKISDLAEKSNILYNSNAQKDIRVKGFIKGKLSIITEGNLYADSSIVYQSLYKNQAFIDKCIKGEYIPLPSGDNSLLGLFCNGNFVVSDKCEPNNYNVLITGNILSNKQITIIETGMGVYMWLWNNQTKEYNPRHFIVYGGRTQNTMQAQTYNPSYKHGLREVLTYDKRLKDQVPPGGPYTDKGARISVWDEKFAKYKP